MRTTTLIRIDHLCMAMEGMQSERGETSLMGQVASGPVLRSQSFSALVQLVHCYAGSLTVRCVMFLPNMEGILGIGIQDLKLWFWSEPYMLFIIAYVVCLASF